MNVIINFGKERFIPKNKLKKEKYLKKIKDFLEFYLQFPSISFNENIQTSNTNTFS